MLQTLRERRCVEDAHENAWKTRAKIWVDAEVGSEACQVRKEAKAQFGSWTETHCESPATETPETDSSRPDYCSKSCPSAVDLAGRNNRLLIPILLYGWLALILIRKHPNFESPTSSTSNRWNQIFRSWTKRCMTKLTSRVSRWVLDAFKNGFINPM